MKEEEMRKVSLSSSLMIAAVENKMLSTSIPISVVRKMYFLPANISPLVLDVAKGKVLGARKLCSLNQNDFSPSLTSLVPVVPVRLGRERDFILHVRKGI